MVSQTRIVTGFKQHHHVFPTLPLSCAHVLRLPSAVPSVLSGIKSRTRVARACASIQRCCVATAVMFTLLLRLRLKGTNQYLQGQE